MEGYEFTEICRKGNLDEVNKFLQNHPNIHNLTAFHCACSWGYLEVAKWLLQIKPDINISASNELVFRQTCDYGQLEVAKWLLHVKPDINISVYNEWTFRAACSYGHLDAAKWLQSLKPWLYVIEYDENGNYTGFKIRSKEEANLEKRKIALHMSLQEKTNILYHLPTDIAKAVTLFI